MKLYAIVETGKHLHWDDDRACIAYWADDEEQAVEAFMQHWQRESGESLDDGRPEYSSCVIETKHEPKQPGPHQEWRDAVLRDAGWKCDTDTLCDSCQLYEMGEFMPVCPECFHCTDCGCICEPPTHAVGFDPIALGT